MAESRHEGIEACVAFASASISVLELVRLGEARQDFLPDDALELLVELVAAHDRLREIFATGADSDVCGMALSVLVLAERTSLALE